MEIANISFHIRDVGVEGLSQLTPPIESRTQHLRDIAATCMADEVFYLNTCNRIEYIFLAKRLSLSKQKWKKTPLIYTDIESVVNHMLSVVLATDSLIIGESQIMGQFKQAYQFALENQFIRSHLSTLLNKILKEAKFIRTEIPYNRKHTSLSTVAAQYFINKIPKHKPTVLFIGAGETNHLFARYLKKRKEAHFIWSTRSQDRLKNTLSLLGGKSLKWKYITHSLLPKVDAIILATHAGNKILTTQALKTAKPKLICDLSLPANADRKSCQTLGIEYLGLDQLETKLKNYSKTFEKFKQNVSNKQKASLLRILNSWNLRKHSSTFSYISESSKKELSKTMHNAFNDELLSLSTESKNKIQKRLNLFVRKINQHHFEHIKSHILNQNSVNID